MKLLVHLFLILLGLLIGSFHCQNSEDDDILTASYPFQGSCIRNDMLFCTNYYPEDEEEPICRNDETLSDDKCPKENNLGSCQKIPLTEEFVYYTGYTSDDTSNSLTDRPASEHNCSLVGGNFNENYEQ